MIQFFKIIIINIVIFSIITIPVFAEQENREFIIKQKKFISELYKDKRYFDCIAETQRLLNYNNSKNNDELLYFINSCYYSGGQYKTLISRIKSPDTIKKDKFYTANILLLSHSFYNLGYFDKSETILNLSDYPNIDVKYQEKLFTSKAEIFVKRYQYKDLLSEIEKAGNYLNSFNSFNLPDFRKDIESYRDIYFRSKWLSASMSALIPGAGQIYSGKIKDGILSFAAVAGTAFGAYYSYTKKEKPLAITMAFFSVLFYCGNIYGAYNSAISKNTELNQKFSEKLINKYNLIYDPLSYGNSMNY
jgi:hypothetical protein